MIPGRLPTFERALSAAGWRVDVAHAQRGELMSLSSAGNDVALRRESLDFWDKHFPFLLSVRTGYSCFAVSLEPGSFGPVVQGIEPISEAAVPEAATFDSLLSQLCVAARGQIEHGSLSAAD